MKAIATILFFITGIVLLAWIAQPIWGVVGQLRTDEQAVSDALSGLSKTKELQQEITGAYNSLDTTQLDSLLTDHVPDNAATGPLLIAIEKIAFDNRVVVSNIDFKEVPKQVQDSVRAATQAAAGGVAGVPANAEELPFSLTVNATYDQFKIFLLALEQYIRIIDIHTISFTPQEKGIYQFSISAKTYYRK
jgi:hypothetical protein